MFPSDLGLPHYIIQVSLTESPTNQNALGHSHLHTHRPTTHSLWCVRHVGRDKSLQSRGDEACPQAVTDGYLDWSTYKSYQVADSLLHLTRTCGIALEPFFSPSDDRELCLRLQIMCAEIMENMKV